MKLNYSSTIVPGIHKLIESVIEYRPIRLKLSGGANKNEGRVEILEPFHGFVCGWSWDKDDAAVVCRMLNLR